MLSVIWLLHTTLLLGQGHLTQTYGIDSTGCQNEVFRAGRIIQANDLDSAESRRTKKRIDRACFNNFRTIDGQDQLPGVQGD